MAYGQDQWAEPFPWQNVLESYSDYLAAQLPPAQQLEAPHCFAEGFFEKICRLANINQQ